MITAIVLTFSVEVNILYKTLQPLNLCIIVIIFCDNLLFFLYHEYYALFEYVYFYSTCGAILSLMPTTNHSKAIGGVC